MVKIIRERVVNIMAAPKKTVKKETTAKKTEVHEHAEENNAPEKAPEKVHEEVKVDEAPAEKKEFKPKVY